MVLWCLQSAVQMKRSLGPVFVCGSGSGQLSSPSRDRDLEDLSRASAAFRNKLVGETVLCSTAVDHRMQSKLRGSRLREYV
ncbi:hypothetical protein CesoFtcFv8_013173 [Champsocephalus esox]|uniref:Uncharacterized protein n=1 Tax=Champsocephalus esox TaxID=159716 RepID=A0AAN8GVT4_9TELE|nr:hypothetical protein CesoFtcFv8_013173 [Champsocephalus esox]